MSAAILEETNLEETNFRHGLPPVWELLRAVSGLIAVGAVLLLVGGTALRDAPASPPPGPKPRIATVTVPRYQGSEAITVFYLVATAEQALIADWREAEAAAEAIVGTRDLAVRTHRVLAARDETQLAGAAEEILEALLNGGREMRIQVIDLRDVNAPIE